ncbi:ABC transporter permease [Saccharospirillum sp.]|uniref:ABC transporter permease n=1 Tax=Saccharospirillum sp. TaxID=2033801 RepID=UPI0034A009FF
MALKHRSPFQVFRSVIFALLVRELKTRFGRWRLGYVWAVLEPMMMIIILALVMTYLRGREPWFNIPVPVFIGIGFLLYNFWQSLAMRAAGAISSNDGLFGYRQVKPYDTVFARAILETIIVVFVAAILVWLADWFFNLGVAIYDPLRAMLVFILLVGFSYGLGLIIAVFGALQPEFAKVIPMVSRPMLFISGVMFPLAVVPENLQPYLLWNPLLHAIEQMRFSLYPQYPAEKTSLMFLAGSALVTLAAGHIVYQAKRHKLIAS